MVSPTKRFRMLRTKVRSNNLAFDLAYIVTTLKQRTPSRRNRRIMNRIVDSVVQARLDELAQAARERYSNVTDNDELVQLIFRYKVTLIGESVLCHVENLLREMNLESYYSKQVISDYIIREFNHRNREHHHIQAYRDEDDKDILVGHEVRPDYRQIQSIVNSI